MTSDSSHAGLMNIGMFSRASLLSVKALRSYHESGMLIPVDIDSETGYRRYHHSQLADAGVIRRLRDLDVGLRDIAKILDARNPMVTRDVLAEHEKRKRIELEQTIRMVEQLSAGVETPALHSPIHVREIEALPILAIEEDVSERDFPIFLGAAFAELGRLVDQLDLHAPGPVGALYPPSIVDDSAGKVVAFHALEQPTRLPAADRGRAKLSQLPAQRCAVAVHHGGYDTLDVTYRQLGAWVAQHATPLDSPVREHYLVSFDHVAHPDDFRTEILWPCQVGETS